MVTRRLYVASVFAVEQHRLKVITSSGDCWVGEGGLIWGCICVFVLFSLRGIQRAPLCISIKNGVGVVALSNRLWGGLLVQMRAGSTEPGWAISRDRYEQVIFVNGALAKHDVGLGIYGGGGVGQTSVSMCVGHGNRHSCGWGRGSRVGQSSDSIYAGVREI